jgi:Kef-type K+ transport system membrane component KefB
MSSRIITAKKWRTMTTQEIAESIEIAARVLKDRRISNEELRDLALAAISLMRVISQKP